jgi:hypothetical protein
MVGIEEYGSRAAFNPRQQQKHQDIRSNFIAQPDDYSPPRTGKIVQAYQVIDPSGLTRILVQIRFDDTVAQSTQSTYTKGFILSHTVEEISLLFGELEDLIGHTVSVISNSPVQPEGIATIINTYGSGNLTTANTLSSFGTLLAPAGK